MKYPQRVTRLALVEAISDPENRPNEPGYAAQQSFYGPLHSLNWGMLQLFSRVNPRQMARQTLAIFSTHYPEDALKRLSDGDLQDICRFYRRKSSRAGAVNDAGHRAGRELLEAVHAPTLVIHSLEDRAVPFNHAEWALENIPGAILVESGFTGHFFWIGPDYARIRRELADFLTAKSS